MPNGFGFFANGRLITIFSAPKYQKNMVDFSRFIRRLSVHISLLEQGLPIEC